MTPLKLCDLRELYLRYVPPQSMHPNAEADDAAWWPAHELGHLLTVPRRSIGWRLFGLVGPASPWNPGFDRIAAYELAAMSVSRRLLTACGRRDLFDDEVKNSEYDIMHLGPRSRARAIVRLRCPRLPHTREGLERLIRRAVGVPAKPRAA